MVAWINTGGYNDEDLIGMNVLPIAVLDTEDYICLDYREDSNSPCVVVWDDEKSEEFEPVTYKAADDINQFFSMLMENKKEI